MRLPRLLFCLVCLSIALPALSGCKQAAVSSSNEQKPAASTAPASQQQAVSNNNLSRPVAQAAAEVKKENAPASSPKLIGSYEMSEVRKEGVTTVLSKIKSTITFRVDGTYARVSKKEEKMYHSDGGRFRVEGNDKLVLTIQVTSKNGILKSPIERAHTFSLSADGEELRLEQEGNTAVFRRVSSRP